jgi:hypothetical protein
MFSRKNIIKNTDLRGLEVSRSDHIDFVHDKFNNHLQSKELNIFSYYSSSQASKLFT